MFPVVSYSNCFQFTFAAVFNFWKANSLRVTWLSRTWMLWYSRNFLCTSQIAYEKRGTACYRNEAACCLAIAQLLSTWVHLWTALTCLGKSEWTVAACRLSSDWRMLFTSKSMVSMIMCFLLVLVRCLSYNGSLVLSFLGDGHNLKGRLWWAQDAEKPSPSSTAKTAAKFSCLTACEQGATPGTLSAGVVWSEHQSQEPAEGNHRIRG